MLTIKDLDTKQVKQELLKRFDDANNVVLNDAKGYKLTDIHKLLLLDYEGACDFLKKKYGAISQPYFLNENCKSPNNKIKRTSEGLVIHHIDEDKTAMLSTSSDALNAPWAYQQGERLVYCNMLEHLILHIKIYIDVSLKECWNGVGLGGVINFIVPELNDWYSGFNNKVNYKQHLKRVIIDQYDLYLLILKYLFVLDDRLQLNYFLTSFNMFYGTWDKNNNSKVFKDIKKVHKHAQTLKTSVNKTYIKQINKIHKNALKDALKMILERFKNDETKQV